MKKRVLSLLLALSMCLTLLPTAALAAEDTEGQETKQTETVPAPEEQEEPPAPEDPEPEEEPSEPEEEPDGEEAPPEPEEGPSEEPAEEPEQPEEKQEEQTPAEEASEVPVETDGAAAAVQEQINALPTDVTAENADEIAARLAAIDEALAALTEEQTAMLDMTRYEVLCEALAALSAVQVAAEHSHTLCSHLEACPAPNHEKAHSEVRFETILTRKVLEDNNYTIPAGSYYLTDTLSPEKQIKITGKVTICLNGNDVKAFNNFDTFSVGKGAELTITDCENSGTITHYNDYTGCAVYVDRGTFNLYGGNIIGNKGVVSKSTFAGETRTNTAGGGVYVSGYDSKAGTFNMYGGSITKNNARFGGGVRVNGSVGVFNLYGGSIANNTADLSCDTNNVFSNGGGVYVGSASSVGATFHMYGGSITGNTVQKGSGGGVFVLCNGAFTMSGGVIGGTGENDANQTESNGGGVYVDATSNTVASFTMSGTAKIVGNIAEGFGGGVVVSRGNNGDPSTFTMSDDAAVTGNVAKTREGGGVYTSGAVIMSGNASVTGNSADTKEGGGVYVTSNGSLTMSGSAAVTGNNSASSGGGVYVQYYSYKNTAGTFTVSGAAKVEKNWKNGTLSGDVYEQGSGRADNILLNGSDTAITIAAPLSDGAALNINKASLSGAVSKIIATDAEDGAQKYFHTDEPSNYAFIWNGEDNTVVLSAATHNAHPLCDTANCTDPAHQEGEHPQVEFTIPLGGVYNGDPLTTGSYFLTDDLILSETLTVSGDVKLCLNGHSIIKNAAGYVIKVDLNATFSLTDCSEGKTGTVTHGTDGDGNKYIGSGVLVNAPRSNDSSTRSTTTFNLYGGSISGNTRSNWQGIGVYVSGMSGSTTTFNMYGGTISDNTLGGDYDSFGGGVYVWNYAAFNMYGGTISNNTAVRYGGGVYLCGGDNGAVFAMKGGSISKNTVSGKLPGASGAAGGGVYVSSGSTFIVSGDAKVIGNVLGSAPNSTANNVYLPKDTTITIGGDGLKDGAEIGITTETTPSGDNLVQFATGAASTALDYNTIFTADATDQNYVVTRSADGVLSLGIHQHNWTYTVSADGKTITAACGNADTCPNTNGGSVMLSKPLHEVYGDGKEAAATLTKTDWAADDVDSITVTYKGVNGTTYAESTTAPTDAGTYTASITVGGQTASVEYTIAKAKLTVTANGNTVTYGDTASDKGVTYNGFVNGEDESVLGGSLTYTFSYSQYGDVGLYIITPGGLTAGNYDITVVSGTLTVTQREVTLQWNNTENRTFGDNKGDITATAGNLVNDDKITVTVSGNELTVGPHTAKATDLSGEKAGNYKLPADVTKDYVIGAAAQKVTFENLGDQSVIYGETLTNKATNDRADNGGSTVTYTSSDPDVAAVDQNGTVTAKKVGTTIITASAAAVTDKYSADEASYTLTVNAKPITVTVNAVSRTYGDANPAFTATVAKDALAGSDTVESLGLTLTTAATTTSGVGSYDVTGTTSNTNYAVTVEGTGKLTVAARPITVTVAEASRIYGEANPVFTYTVTDGTLVNSDDLGLTLTTAVATTSGVGSYDVTGTASNTNYAVTVEGTGKLTVNPKPITVTVDAVSRPYGEENPSFTATAPAGELVGSDTVASLGLTLTTEATAASGVGSYDVTGTASNTNYTVTVDGAKKLTVSKKAITVTAENQSTRVGQELAELTYTFVPELVEGDTFSGALTTTADKDVVGEYPITQGMLKLNDNYELIFVDGTYTVTDKLPQDGFKFAKSTVEKIYGDAAFDFAATGAADGSTVTYASSDPDVAAVDENGKVTILKAGTTVITAAATGTADYEAASVSYTLTVAKKPIAIPVEDATVFTYNGSEQTYALAENEAYTISGNVQTNANETGYTVTVALVDTENTQWADGTTTNKTYTFVIGKKPIAIPTANTTAFTYNGQPQTYTLAEDEAYTIAGNIQTNANETGYTVTVALKDTENTQWSDGTTADKAYSFIIKKAEITITAKDQTAYVGDAAPALDGESYTVTGLIEGEALTTVPTVAYVGDPDMTKAGETAIRASGASAGENYTITYVDGKLTVSVRPSSGGGGGSSAPTYPVNTPSKANNNGSVSSNVKNAAKGSTVTITVKPDAGYKLDALTVTDSKGNALKLTDKGNGVYTFTMPDGKVEVSAAFTEETAEVTSPFADVATDAYYFEAVKWAADKGITGGKGNGLFGSNDPCTRGQIVTFLWRAAGSPEPVNAASFTDVAEDSYCAKAVAWAVENGITLGTTDTTFSPNASCTRAQGMAFLFRAVKASASGTPAFSDVASGAYYAQAVKWATDNGITNGIGNGLFGSNNPCTRAQIVTFLWRLYAGK